MASRYVPPQLRNNSVSSQDESDSATSATANADFSQLLQRSLQDLNIGSANKDAGHSFDEIATYYNNDQLEVNFKALTLHGSITKSHELVYVLLFRNVNPRWESDQIIFAKTNMHILPGYSAFKASINRGKIISQVEGAKEGSTSVDIPFLGASDERNRTSMKENSAKSAAEEQVAKLTQDNTSPLISVFSDQFYRRFTFTGYFRILNIDFLAPERAELIRMLEQKWALTHNSGRGDHYSQRIETKQRNPEKWAESLGLECAVVKMGKVEKEGLEEPKIEKIEVPWGFVTEKWR